MPSCVYLKTLTFPVLLFTYPQVSAAVDTFVGELSCRRRKNASLSEVFFNRVEQNLRGMTESSLKVFLDLVISFIVYVLYSIKHIGVIHG